jgi:cell division protein FtsB
MKRRTPRHATRNPFGLLPRRRVAQAVAPVGERLASVLRMSGRSALSLGLVALMLIFIGLLAANFIGQIVQSANLETRRAELEAEVAAMRADNETLRGAVEFTESDVYIERVAREQLGYAREGDIVILPRVLPAAAPEEAAAAPAAAPLPSVPNWLLWWQALAPPEA